MAERFIDIERRDKVLSVAMNRPKANAVNNAMSRAMHAAWRRLQDDPELLVGVLCSGLDRFFSAGWDLKEVADGAWTPEDDDHPERGAGAGGFAGLVEFWDLDKPIVAAVHGAAVGGGFEMLLFCDVIIAADDTYFMLPELQRGFLPEVGGMQRLPRKLPAAIMNDMMLTGRRMEAQEALHWGLVSRVVPRERLMAETMAIAETIARNAPLATRAYKALIRHNDGVPEREVFARERPGKSGLPIYEQMLASEDFWEGPRAFAEKRESRWKGR